MEWKGKGDKNGFYGVSPGDGDGIAHSSANREGTRGSRVTPSNSRLSCAIRRAGVGNLGAIDEVWVFWVNRVRFTRCLWIFHFVSGNPFLPCTPYTW